MKFRKYLTESEPFSFMGPTGTIDNKIENFIRDNLSGTQRKTDQKTRWSMAKKNLKGVKEKDFNRIWKDLVDEKYLIKVGNLYKWEM